MKVLVTGGAGYIGSTICTALIEAGHIPIILDSLVTGSKAFTIGRIFYHGDIADQELVKNIFKEHPDIECMIHCAAIIIVPESVEKPFEYYVENVAKSMILFKQVSELGCKHIVFSSSASIYDDAENFVVTEESKINARSPYARTKQMIEMVLEDYCKAYGTKGIALRYFNPIGADPKLRTGNQIPNPSHVLGNLVQVATGKKAVFSLTGTNWKTRDGSGIRDYIHIWDLARAHVKAIEAFEEAFEKEQKKSGFIAINVGTGSGVTVKELVTAFEKVFGKIINKQEVESRPGDVAGAYAAVDKAYRLLNWKAELSIEEGIKNALEWEQVRDYVIGQVEEEIS